MSYDSWKTTPPDFYTPDPPPCETSEARYDDEDVCIWCGARPTQGCNWEITQ